MKQFSRRPLNFKARLVGGIMVSLFGKKDYMLPHLKVGLMMDRVCLPGQKAGKCWRRELSCRKYSRTAQ